MEASQWIAGGEICGSLHLAAQEGVQSRPPEARALDRIQKSIRHTHNPAGDEHAMRTEPAEEVHARIRRSKIQPGRPRIRKVFDSFVAPVATQPDDQRAGGRVEAEIALPSIGPDNFVFYILPANLLDFTR